MRFVAGGESYPLREDMTAKLKLLAAPAAERPIVYYAGDKRCFGGIPGLRVQAEDDGWRLIPCTNAAELAAYADDASERAIDLVCETISAVRSTRARYGISPRQELDVVVKVDAVDAALLDAQRSLVESMGNTASLSISPDAKKPEASTVVLGDGVEAFIVLAGLVDFDAERARLQKERGKLEKDEAKLAKKLSNQGFLAKAAPEIIEKDRAKHADLAETIAKIDEQLAELG